MALRATKIPGARESSTIELVASCKGMNDADYYDGIRRTGVYGSEGSMSTITTCVNSMLPIYRGFEPYIESILK